MPNYENLVKRPTTLQCPVEGINFIYAIDNPTSKKASRIYSIDEHLAETLKKACKDLYDNHGVLTIYHQGFYNARAMRGSATPSNHARGLAVDMCAFWVKEVGKISVKGDWATKPTTQKQKILKEILICLRKHFVQVLAADAKSAATRKLHESHFHSDAPGY